MTIHLSLLLLLMHPWPEMIRFLLLTVQSTTESLVWLRGSPYNVMSTLVSLSLVLHWDWWFLLSRMSGYIVDTVVIWCMYRDAHFSLDQ